MARWLIRRKFLNYRAFAKDQNSFHAVWHSAMSLREDAMSPTTASQADARYPSVMVVMDRGPEAAHRATLAAALVDRFSARLIGVAAQPIAVPLYFEAPVSGIESEIELEEKHARRALAAVEATFRGIAGSRNQVEWRQTFGIPTEFALTQARAADLIVASRPSRAEGEFMSMAVDGGDLVMGAGRPVLFVPPGIEHLAAKRVVIGWKDTREARRAVADALPFLRHATEVTVACVGDDSGSKDVCGYLAGHGILADTSALRDSAASAADELSRFAEQEAADLIVCGAYGHSRTREWAFGGVTRDLLDHARLCCLMAH
jgi:nucleotide-binding universal stress UspA family protein